MSTSDVNSLSSDASLIPALSGGAAVVAGPPGSLGWANGPAASSEVAGGTNLLVFVHALRRHWLAAMFLGVICGATLGWLAYVFRPPVYGHGLVAGVGGQADHHVQDGGNGNGQRARLLRHLQGHPEIPLEEPLGDRGRPAAARNQRPAQRATQRDQRRRLAHQRTQRQLRHREF